MIAIFWWKQIRQSWVLVFLWLLDWLWFIQRVFDRLWFIERLFDWLDWFVQRLFGWFDWLWLIQGLFQWLLEWLFQWLLEWLFQRLIRINWINLSWSVWLSGRNISFCRWKIGFRG